MFVFAGLTFDITMFVYEFDFFEIGMSICYENESYFFTFIAAIGDGLPPMSRSDSHTPLLLNDLLIPSF